MRESLADNFDLTGAARYNLHIRHKMRISRMTDANTGAVTPAGWETVLPCFNHSKLQHAINLAQQCGMISATKLPFLEAETLLPDNDERFFSAYLAWLKNKKSQQGLDDSCLCSACTGTENIEQEASNSNSPSESFRLDGPSNVIAQQQEKQQRTHVVSPPGNWQPPLPTHACQSPSPRFAVPSAPMMWINPHMVPHLNWNHCCRKHKEHCGRMDGRGRPPHDDRCPFEVRNSNNTTK